MKLPLVTPRSLAGQEQLREPGKGMTGELRLVDLIQALNLVKNK
jgi:hypothetical protein